MNQDNQPNAARRSDKYDSEKPITDADITRKAKEALDNSIEELSPGISTRLSEARYQALEQASHKGNWNFNFNQMFTFAVPALACVFAIALFLNVENDNTMDDQLFADIQSLDNLENFLIYSNTEDTELAIIEDMEFAYWLSEELANEENIPTEKELGV